MIEFTSEKSEMKFEWDEQKETGNFREHGVMFHTAALVFGDRYRMEIYDRAHSGNEDRYITIGMVDDVLYVVYTKRDDATRLISARIATKKEREVYYDNMHHGC